LARTVKPRHGSNRARAKRRCLEQAARRQAGQGAVVFYRVNRIWHVEAARKCEAGRPMRPAGVARTGRERRVLREQVIEWICVSD
jgi:hypothetical protein